MMSIASILNPSPPRLLSPPASNTTFEANAIVKPEVCAAPPWQAAANVPNVTAVANHGRKRGRPIGTENKLIHVRDGETKPREKIKRHNAPIPVDTRAIWREHETRRQSCPKVPNSMAHLWMRKCPATPPKPKNSYESERNMTSEQMIAYLNWMWNGKPWLPREWFDAGMGGRLGRKTLVNMVTVTRLWAKCRPNRPLEDLWVEDWETKRCGILAQGFRLCADVGCMDLVGLEATTYALGELDTEMKSKEQQIERPKVPTQVPPSPSAFSPSSSLSPGPSPDDATPERPLRPLLPHSQWSPSCGGYHDIVTEPSITMPVMDPAVSPHADPMVWSGSQVSYQTV